MPDTSPRLTLPFLQPSQAQKHVTHNEALQRLDILVQLTVEDFDVTTPPTLPTEGMVHALGVGALGAWAGQDGQLATWVQGAWLFIPPQEGWRAWARQTGQMRVHDNGSWTPLRIEHENLAGVGIGTASDPANRLSVSSPNTLLTHEGQGHQLKINKAASGETASLLFQSNWSGHAEFGLVGENDFSIKFSADGSSWQTGMQIDAANARVQFPTDVQFGSFFGTGPALLTTISAGVVTATGSFHKVNTEGGTSDIIHTIHGGKDGDILILRSNLVGNQITVQNGTGNIRCGTDRVLDDVTNRIILHKRGSDNWHMLCFADN